MPAVKSGVGMKGAGIGACANRTTGPRQGSCARRLPEDAFNGFQLRGVADAPCGAGARPRRAMRSSNST